MNIPQYRPNNTNCSIERKRIIDQEFEYFVTDENGNTILNIDSKYYNGKIISEISEYYQSEVEIIPDIYIARDYYFPFRFWEFSYDFRTPKYKKITYKASWNWSEEIIEQSTKLEFVDEGSFEDNEWGESDIIDEQELIEDFGITYSLPIQEDKDIYHTIEVEEKGNKDVVLKTIIDDSGRIVKDGILDILKSTPSWFLIELPVYFNSPHQVENLYNSKNKLLAVVDVNGEFIVKPTYNKIDIVWIECMFIKHNINLKTFDNSHPKQLLYFNVGSIYFVDSLGNSYQSKDDLIANCTFTY